MSVKNFFNNQPMDIMNLKIKTCSQTFSMVACASTMLLTVSTACAQDVFVGNWFSPGTIYQITPGGSVSTFTSGDTGEIEGMAFNGMGNLYVADALNNQIDVFTPSGSESTFATGLNSPQGLAFNSAGDLFVANYGNGDIYEYMGGVRSTFATGLTDLGELAFNADGDLFATEKSLNTILEFTPNGTQSTFATGLDIPVGMAFNNVGDMFVANTANEASGAGFVSEITPGGQQTTIVNGLTGPASVTFDQSGDLFVADQTIGAVTEINTNGVVSTFATGLGHDTVLAVQGVVLPVPEPSTTVLVAISGVAFLIRRFKK
jgi:sugar lactone lactonase YvrE